MTTVVAHETSLAPRLRTTAVYIAGSLNPANRPRLDAVFDAVAGLPNFEIALDYRTNNPPDELFGPDYNSMPAAQRIVALDGDIARRKFDLDRTAIERCDVCILVEPAGKSAHLEAGFAAGLSKRVIVLLDEAPAPVELMLAFASNFVTNISGLLRLLTAGT